MAQEMGKDKFVYYKQNAFWQKVGKVVRAGYSVDRVIENTYSV